MSKSLLVLGGAEKTRPLVRYARSMGIDVLLCDRNEDPPCRDDATAFFCISTTDLPALRSLVESRQVDGVVSFGSDLMATVAARLCSEFGLPGNPPKAIETLVQKDRFRRFLREHDFAAPRALGTDKLPADSTLRSLRLPVLVKPADGAGSTAVTRIDDWAELDPALQRALNASRGGRAVIEELLQRDHPHMIGGDIFVEQGKVVFWGLLNSHRDNPDRPFLPTGTSYPLALPAERQREVRGLLQKLVTRLELCFGGMNVEVMYASDGKPYIIELAPRNGGNRIPELLNMATGFDLIAALVDASLGRPVQMRGSECDETIISNFMIQSDRHGRYRDILIADELRPYVDQICLDVSPGEEVRAFERATDALGTLFLRFNNGEEQQRMRSRLTELVSVRLEQVL